MFQSKQNGFFFFSFLRSTRGWIIERKEILQETGSALDLSNAKWELKCYSCFALIVFLFVGFIFLGFSTWPGSWSRRTASSLPAPARLLGKAGDWSSWVIWFSIGIALCGDMGPPYDKDVMGAGWLSLPEQQVWGSEEKLLPKKRIAITRRR